MVLRHERLLLANREIAEDPTLAIDTPRAAERFPKTLSEAQVEALLTQRSIPPCRPRTPC